MQPKDLFKLEPLEQIIIFFSKNSRSDKRVFFSYFEEKTSINCNKLETRTRERSLDRHRRRHREEGAVEGEEGEEEAAEEEAVEEVFRSLSLAPEKPAREQQLSSVKAQEGPRRPTRSIDQLSNGSLKKKKISGALKLSYEMQSTYVLLLQNLGYCKSKCLDTPRRSSCLVPIRQKCAIFFATPSFARVFASFAGALNTHRQRRKQQKKFLLRESS